MFYLKRKLKEFGMEGRKMAEKHFDERVVVSEHYRIYQEVLRRKRTS